MTDNENMPHPLEILALQLLPEKARIKRIASMAIKQKFGRLSYYHIGPQVADITKKLNEPRGKILRTRRAIKDEIARQREIIARRANAARRVTYYLQNRSTVDFSIQYCWTVDQRRKAMVVRKLYELHDLVDRSITCTLNCDDIRFRRGEIFGLLIPHSVVRNGVMLTNENAHRTRLLMYRVGDAKGVVRVSISCKSVDEAIAYLKPKKVLLAEDAGKPVIVDWHQKGFRVKNRNGWVVIPFKTAGRKRSSA